MRIIIKDASDMLLVRNALEEHLSTIVKKIEKDRVPNIETLHYKKQILDLLREVVMRARRREEQPQ